MYVAFAAGPRARVSEAWWRRPLHVELRTMAPFRASDRAFWAGVTYSRYEVPIKSDSHNISSPPLHNLDAQSVTLQLSRQRAQRPAAGTWQYRLSGCNSSPQAARGDCSVTWTSSTALQLPALLANSTGAVRGALCTLWGELWLPVALANGPVSTVAAPTRGAATPPSSATMGAVTVVAAGRVNLSRASCG